MSLNGCQSMKIENVPQTLRKHPHWVLWKVASRTKGDKPTKLPFQLDGSLAKANDPTTWAAFDDACQMYGDSSYEGVGYEFGDEDGLCGIDLDGCRNPVTGEVAQWARQIVISAGSYAEVSPSGTGIKIFVFGKCPFDTGRQIEVPGAESMVSGGKAPKIEIYDHARFFAVTGMRLAGVPHEPQPAQETLDWLKRKYFAKKFGAHQKRPEVSVIDRARQYVGRIEGAISGQGGHNQTFRAACVLVLGFGLSESEAFTVLSEWNKGCKPEWSEKELWHKVKSANRQAGPRCWLRDVEPEDWDSVEEPKFESPKPETAQEVRLTTLTQAAQKYINHVKSGGSTLVTLGIPSLDFAIGGGVEAGEVVILAARPSHGKSAIALQVIHNWTSLGMSCLMVSEEMSDLMLGKRAMQFITELPQDQWYTGTRFLESDLGDFMAERAECYIAENCGTAEAAVAQIDKAVQEFGIKCAIVDYAQLLRSPGKSRYEQVTNTSIVLRQCASRNKIIIIVLAQLSREIESRDKFMPIMSDLKESGQLEQDADVIVFLVWPWKLDNQLPITDYKLYIAKNRNREIVERVAKCKFLPSRQMLEEIQAKDCTNYTPEFEHWTNK